MVSLCSKVFTLKIVRICNAFLFQKFIPIARRASNHLIFPTVMHLYHVLKGWTPPNVIHLYHFLNGWTPSLLLKACVSYYHHYHGMKELPSLPTYDQFSFNP